MPHAGNLPVYNPLSVTVATIFPSPEKVYQFGDHWTVSPSENRKRIDRVEVEGGVVYRPAKSIANEFRYDRAKSVTIYFSNGEKINFTNLRPVMGVAVVAGIRHSGASASSRTAHVPDSSSRMHALGRGAYARGVEAMLGEEIIGDMPPPAVRWRGDFDYLLTYEEGDRVRHGGRWWEARRRVTPPWFPMLSRGDVPGESDYWILLAEDVSRPVILGASYTDSGTVRLFQAAIVALNSADPLLRLGARMWPPDAKEYARIVDGIYGPNTKAAAARWNSYYMGKPQLGEAITDETLASLPKVTVKPTVEAPKPAAPRPLPVTTFPPTPVASVGTAPGASIFQREVLPGVPLWQAALGGLGALGLGYGTYRIVQGRVK